MAVNHSVWHVRRQVGHTADRDGDLGSFVGRGTSVTGIYVGSREDFVAMNAIITEHRLRPVIDRVFTLEDAPAAYEHMASGSHLGKIVIAL